MSHKPTPEQAAIIDAAGTGADLTIEAGAGTGKTSTLKMLAREQGPRRGAYLAYNRSIATDAAREFPSGVVCKTAHSFAYGSVGRAFAHRLNGPRVPARQAAIFLGLNEPVQVGEVKLAPQQLARLVGETVQRFCYSADEQIQRMHVPLVNGLDRPGQAELARYLLPIAQRAWDTDITVTRAQRVLDREGLAWVDTLIGPAHPSMPLSPLARAVIEHPEAILPDPPDPWAGPDLEDPEPEHVPVVSWSSGRTPAPRQPRCTCDDLELVHEERKNGSRGACRNGFCRCQVFEPANVAAVA